MDLGVGVRVLIIAWTDLETALSAVARIRHFVTTTPQERDAAGNHVDPLWPTTGSVEFRDLSASYAETSSPILCNINLAIQPGEKIGICGRTGSGKSSLIATLFGLLYNRSGYVFIDGISIDTIPLSILRSNIIAIPQEPFFLGGSVRKNLTSWSSESSGQHVSDADMIDALGKVGLWEKLDLATPPGETGLDTSLDNIDAMFSQGERQLFCLGRAILQDGKIIVLDEATSR
jgi:ATP-binding cassette, subfamily C (CFTR/MRP), member 1